MMDRRLPDVETDGSTGGGSNKEQPAPLQHEARPENDDQHVDDGNMQQSGEERKKRLMKSEGVAGLRRWTCVFGAVV